jgi:hypothetical protein
MAWSDFVRRDASGNVEVDTRGKPPVTPGTVLWSGPLAAHTLENVGTGLLHVVSVELKRGPASNAGRSTSNLH